MGVFSSESLQKFLVLNVFLLFLIIWKRKNIKRDNTTLNAEIVMRNCHLKKSGALNIVQGSINQKSHSFYVAQESFHKKLKFCSVKLAQSVSVCEKCHMVRHSKQLFKDTFTIQQQVYQIMLILMLHNISYTD